MNKKIAKISIISFLLIGVVYTSILIMGEQAQADNQDIVDVEVTYDSGAAKIDVSMSDIQEHNVTKITFNGIELNLLQPSLYVNHNGTYTLQVETIEEGQVNTLTQMVEVDGIINFNTEKVGAELVPDYNFYNYLVNTLGLPSDFTVQDLKNIDTIRYYTPIPSERIRDITGVEHMTGLQSLYMNDQAITSLEVMRGVVYPELNQIEFNNWLTGENAIHDFSMFTATSFPKLQGQLMFNNNGITDEHLATLPTSDCLREAVFHFQNNNITNIDILKYYSDAKRLNFNHNKIEDISVLKDFNNLTSLELSNNEISDIQPLASNNMSKDMIISLNNNHIVDVSILRNVKAKLYLGTTSKASDAYFDENNNSGQTYTNPEVVIGDYETGEVEITSCVKNKREQLVPIYNVGGITQNVVLNPQQDTQYTYEVRFTTSDTWYIAKITQPIYWWKAPTITADTLEFTIGEAYDLRSGIQAYDSQGNDITSNIEIVDSTINDKEIGDYTVTYKVVDARGYESTFTRDIVVQGRTEIQTQPQKYELDNPRINESIISYATIIQYQKDTEGNTVEVPIEVDSDNISYTINGQDTLEFKQPGIYEITYKVKIKDNYEISKTTQVLISQKHSVMDRLGNLTLGGNDVIVPYEELSDLNESSVINKANIKAYKINRDTDGNIVSFGEYTNGIKVHQENFKEIKQASMYGGTYKLLLTAQISGAEVSREIYVHVLGCSTQVVEDDSLVSASSFVLSSKEALKLSKEDAIAKANVTLYRDGGVFDAIDKIDANQEEFNKIKENANVKGTYPLEYTVTYMDKGGNKKDVNVQVQVSIYTEEIQNISGNERKDLPASSKSVTAGDTSLIASYYTLILISGYIILKKGLKK